MIASRLAAAVRLCVFALVSLLFLIAPARAADPTFPELNGRRVVDEAHLLSDDDQAELTQKLADLEARTTDQMVVVTVPSLQDNSIEDYGYKLGRHWGIGQKGVNNGLLLIVAPHERKVRIEVGYGLEDVMTDALASVIIQEQILPEFRDEDYPRGIRHGVDAIITQLTLDKPQALANVAAHKHDKIRSLTSKLIGLSITLSLIFLVPFLFLMHAIIPRRFQPGWVWSSFEGGGGGMFGGGGGFSGGGGGFSGGGGSFGGGGASGSW